MSGLTLWMRIVGGLYLFLCVAAIILRLPIRAEGPKGLLDRASEGDPIAKFVVDVWFMLGLYFAVIGIALLTASRMAAQARVLVWTVVGFEVAGIVVDIYKLARGYDRRPPITWLVIHSVIIASAVYVLRA